MSKVNVAIVGCGNISGIYLENLTDIVKNVTFDNVNVYAIADLIPANTKAKSEKFNIERIMTFEEMLEDENIQIIVNLTTPPLHYDISKRALLAGKHVHSEKPLSISYAQGKELVQIAEEKGLFLGCAPDTFLGGGIQTCRKIIDEGLIGEVIGANAFMMCHGHEGWHPNPAFYYQVGGGPMFDMGPYYLTALVSLIGSVDSVAGMTHTSFPTRRVTSQPNYGQIVDVEVPTHVNGLLRFHNGAVGNIITSFDVWGSKLPWIEIHGTRGSIQVPDPNGFGGQVMLKQYFDNDFKPYPSTFGYTVNSRGLGVWDMADCILTGRKDLRASGKLALHVLEIMEKIHVSSDIKAQVDLETAVERPTPMSM